MPNRAARGKAQFPSRKTSTVCSVGILINVAIIAILVFFAAANFHYKAKNAAAQDNMASMMLSAAAVGQQDIPNAVPYVHTKPPTRPHVDGEYIIQSLATKNVPNETDFLADKQLENRHSVDVQTARPVFNAASEATNILRNHPIHQFASGLPLDEIISMVYSSQGCGGRPIFLGMASVGSNFYRQMVENFIYTMVKFNLSDCSLLICVTDLSCVDLCNHLSFPCYNFQYQLYHDSSVPKSALEQIALLKLFHVPKALKRGVDIFTVDLDVGFLDDPMMLVNYRVKYPRVDVFVQMDISFVMNRSVVGWRTWYTKKMPNIGLMLTRGNDKTVKLFDRAYKDYASVPANLLNQPGKDQNKLADALRYSSAFDRLTWKFFSPLTAVLADKIYKFENKTIELGGEVSFIRTLYNIIHSKKLVNIFAHYIRPPEIYIKGKEQALFMSLATKMLIR
jgi:hypothetical protein